MHELIRLRIGIGKANWFLPSGHLEGQQYDPVEKQGPQITWYTLTVCDCQVKFGQHDRALQRFC